MTGTVQPPLFWRTGSAPASVAASDKSRFAMRSATHYAASAARAGNMQTLQHDVCQAAAQGLDTDFAKLLVYDPVRRDFLLVAGVGWQPGLVGRLRMDADVGTAAGFAWHAHESVICNTLGEDTRFRVPDLLTRHGLASSINVPVPGGANGAFGVLEVESPKRGGFDADDLSFLHLLAYSLAAARDRLGRQALHDEQLVEATEDHRVSLQEMQHRVRNDLQGICSSLDREKGSPAGAADGGGYDRVSRRVLALAGLYDHLLGVRLGRTVDMGDYLGSLCTKIAAAGNLPVRGITLQAEVQPVAMAIDRAGRLAIAVNELVANAAEHAFPSGQPGRITVRLIAPAAGSGGGPVVTVGDDGCGFTGPRPGGAGLGFVDRLVRGAGGVLTRTDGGGTEWRIALVP